MGMGKLDLLKYGEGFRMGNEEVGVWIWTSMDLPILSPIIGCSPIIFISR
jgi:hypothetical protein